ncbi:uncharacterized protein LOC143909155 [Arctopsyche grandis]|uniref:uncharacterized protein LOC143909155 n=1 Tax=Arctopsyche grandis TaxID=121162 RepID=UPI00406D9B83
MNALSRSLTCLGIFIIYFGKSNCEESSMEMFDFTSLDNVNDWIEQSDTMKIVGLSKGVMILQKTDLIQNAIFFALINPQPNGVGFAGVTNVGFSKNFTQYTGLKLMCRAQGEYSRFKVLLRHRDENQYNHNSYDIMFQGPKEDFGYVSLPFSEFKRFQKGKKAIQDTPLDVSNITGISIQFYSGVEESEHQSGPATLEIEHILAYS